MLHLGLAEVFGGLQRLLWWRNQIGRVYFHHAHNLQVRGEIAPVDRDSSFLCIEKHRGSRGFGQRVIAWGRRGKRAWGGIQRRRARGE